jgi:Ribonuclease G/E
MSNFNIIVFDINNVHRVNSRAVVDQVIEENDEQEVGQQPHQPQAAQSCPHCGQVGHSRRSSHQCLANTRNILNRNSANTPTIMMETATTTTMYFK